MQSAENGRVYAKGFGEINVKRAVEIYDMSLRGLIPAWEACVRNAMSVKVEVEDEISKASQQEVSWQCTHVIDPASDDGYLLSVRWNMRKGHSTTSLFSTSS